MAQLQPPMVIAVDVDGTLIAGGRVNVRLAAWLRVKKAEGFSLMLWSMRGQEYARCAAESAGIADLFDVIASKPGYIVDDKGWSWIRGTRVINSEVGQ